MENLLPRVYRAISDYLEKHKAVSSEELMWKISQETDRLNNDEKKYLKELLQGDVKQMIFDGITGKTRLSVFSPDMHVRLNYLGHVFFTPPTHKYVPEELAKAFKRLAQMRFSEISQKVENSVVQLMKKSGYKVSELSTQISGVQKNIQAVKEKMSLQLLLFPSIVMLQEGLEELKEIKTDYVIVVPSESTPAPFVNFIREHLDVLKDNPKMMIWVVNPDEEAVNPLIGNLQDKEIWDGMKDPEKSLQASKNWMRGAVRSRVLDEDF